MELYEDDLEALAKFLQGFKSLCNETTVTVDASGDARIEVYFQGDVLGHLRMNDNGDYAIEVGP